MQVRPGHYKADGSVGAIVASNSCEGAGGARETVMRKSSGREWEKESKNHRKLAGNNRAEQHPKETSRKTALQGTKPHLSWVPTSHKSNKEGSRSQKELADQCREYEGGQRKGSAEPETCHSS